MNSSPFLLILLFTILHGQLPPANSLPLTWGTLELERVLSSHSYLDSSWHDRVALHDTIHPVPAADAGACRAEALISPPPRATPQALLAVPRRARALCELLIGGDHLHGDCAKTIAGMLRDGRSLRVSVSMILEESFTMSDDSRTVDSIWSHTISVCATDQATLDKELAAAAAKIGFGTGEADSRTVQLGAHLMQRAGDLSALREAVISSASMFMSLPMFCTPHAPYHICLDASSNETAAEAVHSYISDLGGRAGTPMETRVASFMTYKYLGSRLSANGNSNAHLNQSSATATISWNGGGQGPAQARRVAEYFVGGAAGLLLVATVLFCALGIVEGGETQAKVSSLVAPQLSQVSTAKKTVDLLKGVATGAVIMSHTPLATWFYPGTSYVIIGGGERVVNATPSSFPTAAPFSARTNRTPWLLAEGGLVLCPFSILSHTRHAVHLFFFLTGFVNMLPLVRPPVSTPRRLTTPQSIAAFYARRLKRVWPLLVVAAFSTLDVKRWGDMTEEETKKVAWEILLMFSFSFTLLPNHFTRFSSMWTLGVTMNYIMVFPGLIMLYRRMSNYVIRTWTQRVLLGGAMVLFLAVRIPSMYPPFDLYHALGGFGRGTWELEFRIPHVMFWKDSIYGSGDDFLAGMMLACWLARHEETCRRNGRSGGGGGALVRRPWLGCILGMIWLQLGCTVMDFVQLGALPLWVGALVPNAYHVAFTLILASLWSTPSTCFTVTEEHSRGNVPKRTAMPLLRMAIDLCGFCLSLLSSLLRFIGRRSYSIYLFQTIVLKPMLRQDDTAGAQGRSFDEEDSTLRFFSRVLVVTAIHVVFCACIEP